MHSGLGRKNWNRLNPVHRYNQLLLVDGLRLVVAREMPNHHAFAVEDLERNRSRRVSLQVVVNDCPIWRIVTVRGLFRIGSTLVVSWTDAHGVARLEQIRIGVRNVRAGFSEWRDIVENPEGTSVGRDGKIVIVDG